MLKPIQEYHEFWPFYLDEHRHPRNRALHLLGTGAALVLLIASLATLDWRLVVAAMIVGYAFAWIGHFFFERNRPATFTFPLWSVSGGDKLCH